MQKATSEKEVAFKNMARPAGIEPTTSWFVAKHSNPTELRALNQFISIYPLFLFVQLFADIPKTK